MRGIPSLIQHVDIAILAIHAFDSYDHAGTLTNPLSSERLDRLQHVTRAQARKVLEGGQDALHTPLVPVHDDIDVSGVAL
jgi:hypothetical protein